MYYLSHVIQAYQCTSKEYWAKCAKPDRGIAGVLCACQLQQVPASALPLHEVFLNGLCLKF